MVELVLFVISTLERIEASLGMIELSVFSCASLLQLNLTLFNILIATVIPLRIAR
jgi:hypothetical protein